MFCARCNIWEWFYGNTGRNERVVSDNHEEDLQSETTDLETGEYESSNWTNDEEDAAIEWNRNRNTADPQVAAGPIDADAAVNDVDHSDSEQYAQRPGGDLEMGLNPRREDINVGAGHQNGRLSANDGVEVRIHVPAESEEERISLMKPRESEQGNIGMQSDGTDDQNDLDGVQAVIAKQEDATLQPVHRRGDGVPSVVVPEEEEQFTL